MEWWDDIWLNEGFATWMSWKPMKAWHPEWHNQLDEIQETSGSLWTDSIASIRPIRQKAETPAEIEALFDGIAYGKAASVLRTVEAYVGPEVFQQGRERLSRRSTRTETPPRRISGIRLRPHRASRWTKLCRALSISRVRHWSRVKSSCTGDVTKVTLSQRRYFSDRRAARCSVIGALAHSGVVAKARLRRMPRRFCSRAPNRPLRSADARDWVYADAGGRGYFRSSLRTGRIR